MVPRPEAHLSMRLRQINHSPCGPCKRAMSFVSYAQNYEDVMLWRALRGVQSGVYIDVGAWSPDLDSVTKAFSERGWYGINVEPNPIYFAELVERRPNDINLDIAIGDHDGMISMSFIPESGLSTAEEQFIHNYEDAGYTLNTQQVKISTLAAIWAEHLRDVSDVHFLKVDVEGLEKAVLTGNDWTRFRPWIVVVEATLPTSQIENHHEWEGILLTAGYIFAYADGLNRYYVAQEHRELIDAFKYPPNVFDDFTVVDLVEARRGRDQFEQALKAAETRVASTEEKLTSVERSRDQFEQASRTAEQRVAFVEERLVDVERRLETSEWELAESRQQQQVLEEAILSLETEAQRVAVALQDAATATKRYEAVLRSTSWRLTAPGRALSRLFIKDSGRTREAIKQGLRPLLENLHSSVKHHPRIKRAIWSVACLVPPIRRRLVRFAEVRARPADTHAILGAGQPPQAAVPPSETAPIPLSPRARHIFIDLTRR